MAYTREDVIHKKIGNELKEKAEGLRKSDHEDIASILGVSRPYLRERINFWNDGWVFGTSSLSPHKPGKKLETLIKYMECLGFKEEDGPVQEIYNLGKRLDVDINYRMGEE